MKKLTLSVAALSIALTTFGQTSNDSITFSKNEIEAIMITIEEVLYWQQEDMENGYTNMGSHDEGWGSNYWLTELVDEMRSRYTGENNYIQPYNR
tara:strand:+ start:108 stop:392 length:285 start_codon:yes stop_codon:yes gene_type:complete